MSVRSHPFHLRIAGPLALFTRPEMKVERVSYDIITPSAARGVLEAVLWKPQMRWIVCSIKVMQPVRFVSVKRNEVASKMPATFVRWSRENAVDRDFFAYDDRQQRNSVLLRDVDYVVEAVIELTDKAGPEDSIAKFVDMFRRRVEKGQQYHQPYLGCREFPACVSLADGTEQPGQEFLGNEIDLGWMLNDIEYVDGRAVKPHFFHAMLRDGVASVPALGQEVKK